MRLWVVTRLVLVNLLVLIGIFAGLNLLSLGVLEGYMVAKRAQGEGPATTTTESRWWDLPVYSDEDKKGARALWEEFGTLESHYVPFTAWSRLPFEGVGTTINAAGDRVHTPPPWGGERHTVVRFFGGSTIWGTGASDQGTIPAIYNGLNPQFIVHNHGEAGYSSRQSLDRMITLISRNEPMDVAVLYEGVNEVANCMVGEDGPTHGEVQRLRALLGPQPAPPDFYDHLWSVTRTLLLSRTAELATAVGSRMRAVGSRTAADSRLRGVVVNRWDCDENPTKAAEVAQILVNNWEMAHAIAEARGVLLIAILQPNAHVSSPSIDHLQPFLIGDMGPVYRVLYPAIQAELRERGHDWIYDMTDGLDGIGPVLIDDFHITESGNRAIAGRIDSILRAVGVGA